MQTPAQLHSAALWLAQNFGCLQEVDTVLQQQKDAGLAAQPQDVLQAQKLELTLRAAHEEVSAAQQCGPTAHITAARLLASGHSAVELGNSYTG